MLLGQYDTWSVSRPNLPPFRACEHASSAVLHGSPETLIPGNGHTTRFLQGQFSALSLTTFPFNSLYMDRLFLVTLACPDGQRRASGEGRLLADSGGKLGIVHE